MRIETLSDRELLAIVVGEEFAEQFGQKPLVELFGYVRSTSSADPLAVNDVPANYLQRDPHPVLAAAKELLVRCMGERLHTEDELTISSPEIAQAFLTGKLGHLEHEVFSVLFLNNQHRVLSFDVLFQGTISGCHVERREVVKRALQHNAAAVLFCHNHPSAATTPSTADIDITRKLEEALGTVDIRVLDHIIVARNLTISMKETGLI